MSEGKKGPSSIYSQDLADRICAELAEGTPLRTLCKAEGMPSKATIFRWLRSIPEFLEQYQRAKEESADALVEESLDIADNATNDWMASHDAENPGWIANKEHIARSRLRVETRKWLASKLKPKKYGERVSTEISGPNGGPVQIQPVVNVKIASG